MVDEVHSHMKEMLVVGTIHSSQSPWCNAIVLVCKKDRGLCLCTNFPKFNVRTKKDSYLLPQIQEVIESLVGAGYFSFLDLKAGIWQISMDEASKQYNAFTVGNIGFFECECMLFGLCYAPATFQRLMKKCLGELNLAYWLIYLDDVIVFSKTEEEHLHCLCIVFECFMEHNLKLKPTKCEFFKNEINYLAHHFSKDALWPSKENLKALAGIAPPQTYTEIWAFLGFVGHYQWFSKGFTHIAQPLYKHLSGAGASKKNKHVTVMEDTFGAFKAFKNTCLETTVLAFADFSKPFLLETDVSRLGLGAVLSQKQTDGQYHPVAYMSCSLAVHEHNYNLMKQEFLVLKWAIMEQFQEYLLWKPFVVKTDNNLFTYIMTTPN